MDDGRVEDGSLQVCVVCNVHTHMYEADGGVCPQCAWEGWVEISTLNIRRGDTVLHGGHGRYVEAVDRIGKTIEVVCAGGYVFHRRAGERCMAIEGASS